MTDTNNSEWSMQSMRVYVEAKLDAQEKSVQVALSAADRAILKAESANDKRFESVNEFRGQLRDQTLTFIPREEVNLRFAALEERLQRAERLQANVLSESHGKLSITGPLWALGGAVATSVFAGVLIWLITTFAKAR